MKDESYRRKQPACLVCSGKPSSHLRRLVKQLEEARVGRLAFECTVLGKRVDVMVLSWEEEGPAECRVPKWKVPVEMDGEGHFSIAYKKPTSQQFAFDREFDAQCEQQQQCLVRLHHMDHTEWVPVVQAAIQRRGGPTPQGRFVTYTSSYAREAQRQAQGRK